MSVTIEMRMGKFSLEGLKYYLSHRKAFTKRSFATLLKTTTEGLTTNSISVAINCILKGKVWVERDGKVVRCKPETELEEGDMVVFWMILDNIKYQFKNNKLVLVNLFSW